MTRKQQAERLRHGAEFVDSSAPKQPNSQASVRRSSTKKRQPMPEKDYVPTPVEQKEQDYIYQNDVSVPSPAQ